MHRQRAFHHALPGALSGEPHLNLTLPDPNQASQHPPNMQLGGTLIRIACNQAARGSFVNALGGQPPTIPRAGSARIACAVFLDDPSVPANLLTDLGNLVSAHCVIRAGSAAGTVLFEQAVPAARFNPALTFTQWTGNAGAHFEFALTPTDTNLPAGPLHIAVGVTTADGGDIPLAYCSTARLRDYGIFNAAPPVPADYTSWSKAEADARYAAASAVHSFAAAVTSVGDAAAHALETLPTIGLATPLLRTVLIAATGELQDWVLLAGADANDAVHQRPNDFNPSTNPRVWTRKR